MDFSYQEDLHLLYMEVNAPNVINQETCKLMTGGAIRSSSTVSLCGCERSCMVI